jgi:hypothetical protein
MAKMKKASADVGTIQEVKIEGVNLNSASSGYVLIAFNNDTTPFMDVMKIFRVYCNYDEHTAFMYTKKIHESQSCAVYWDTKERCDFVAKKFGQIKVQTKVEKNN